MRMRIRYDYEGDIGVSRQTYGTSAGSVRIVIDRANYKFEIVDSDGKAVVAGGNTQNFIVLLRQAKRALEHLGCTFETEERDRDYGVRARV